MGSASFGYRGRDPVLTSGHSAMASTSKHMYDAIVVGAGHNGLTAACYMARGAFLLWCWSGARSWAGAA